MTKPRAAGKSSLSDLHGVELALDIAAPKLEKPAQFGKIRRDIELLPDETLQQVGMIGKVVDDLRGRQPTFAKLWLQDTHVVLSAVRLPDNEHGRESAPSATKNKRLQCVSSGSSGLLPARSAFPLKRSREGLDRERLKLMDEGRCSSRADVRHS